MATYTSSYTGAQIDSGIGRALPYADYTTAIAGTTGTISNANLAAAINNRRALLLNFTTLGGESGVICNYQDDGMDGIKYQAIDVNGVLALIVFTISNSTVSFTITKGAGCVNYLTSPPSTANTDGLKFVVLSSEPAQKVAGYVYFILS